MHFWPGPAGAKEWTHACYSPKTELLYVPVQDVGATATRRRREFKESIPYWGAGAPWTARTKTGDASADHPRTAQERWRWSNDPADVLVAAGHGRRPRVWRVAHRGVQRLERRTAENCCSASSAAAATTVARRATSVHGRQYVVAPSGWRGWAEGPPPKMLGSSHGCALFAFALPE